jgi:cytoplasmic iron level regulating protein YaaA (DUF328/UPF0246 family)
MLTVISPAKRLNEKPHALPEGFAPTKPDFAADAVRLAKLARGLTADQLCALMDISPALGALNHDRFRAFRADAEGRPAAFLFDGDTYAGLEARAMEPDTLRWARLSRRFSLRKRAGRPRLSAFGPRRRAVRWPALSRRTI